MTAQSRFPVFNKLALAGAAIGAAFLFGVTTHGAHAAGKTPAPAMSDPLAATPGSKTAVFAGGCFWGVQGVFEHVNGVSKAVAGYSGGEKSTADYETVSTGTTGHAESVEITYDPSVVSYSDLLQIYFSVVTDPTTLNKQGPDHGSQYRSEIFVTDPEQKAMADAYIAQLQSDKTFSAPIVTTVEPLKGFYKAEDYHQDFLAHNPTYPYIAINDMPKVTDLHKFFPEDYRTQPVLTTNADSSHG